MKNRTARFLIISIICISVLCVIVFSAMTFRMNKKSAETIGELGNIYMSGMSEQAVSHFGDSIRFRFWQVRGLQDAAPPGSMSFENTVALLNEIARLRDFESLALCMPDGSFYTLYGKSMSVDEPEEFMASVMAKELAMATATNEAGDRFVLFSIPAEYTIPAEYATDNGKESLALVAGLPISFIGKTLSLSSMENSEMVYYFIIDGKGEFIVKEIVEGETVNEANYFDRVNEEYESIEGLTKEEFLSEIRYAITYKHSVSEKFVINGDRRFLYGASLTYSDWYLLLFMPYGRFDASVNTLGNSWVLAAVLSCMVILGALIIVFAYYFRLTRKHVKELDEARRLAEKASKSKSEFLSNMSHDIRTPMNGIVGMTAIASANIDNIPQVQNCLKKITLSSKHLLGLINDILDMSKIESGKLTLHVEKTSLQETLKGVLNIIQPQAKEKKQRFDVYVYDIPNEHVYCDGVRLSQILLNLLGNAVKFTAEGGNICIVCYEESSPKGDGFVRVHFRVKDNGMGMTDEFRIHIFDAFAREDNNRVQKTEGTGLGMTITKYIVDAMQGNIEVESQPQKGTEFHITLDFEIAATEEKDMMLENMDVLVVIDNELSCENVISTLKSIGCRAEYALDGERALKMVETRNKNKNPYRAVLLDCGVKGMENWGLVKAVKERCGAFTDIILLTASDWSDLDESAKSAGASASVSMPLFRSSLYYALKNLCERKTEVFKVEEHTPVVFEGRRILLAEDNDLNREIADELLSELGLIIENAEDGKICLDKFVASPVGYYDAVLMDIRMPVMNGYEATEAIRRTGRADAKTIPIIAMSADAFSDDIKHCLDVGMNSHIAKPIDMDTVAKTLQKYMR